MWGDKLGVFFDRAIGDGSSVCLARRATCSRETEAVAAPLSDRSEREIDTIAAGIGTLRTALLAHGVPGLTLARGVLAVAIVVLVDQQPMVRVHGFVGFPAKQESESANLSASPRKRNGGFMDEVDDYLWEVYRRLPIKKDSSGDFSWKDPAAAQRLGMSLQDYVIGGMALQFREQLYHAGHAMDAAGVQWSILSAFRDDYRQRLASGFKASIGNSLHGGSRRTGGYGHGRAIDITSADSNHPEEVWNWIDQHAAQYGLRRPLPGPDPAHIQ